MGWYSTPFNYDGTSPTQVRDDLQKANENFQALSDVFENGTPLSGRIKSSYIPGGGGSVLGDIVVNSVTVSNSNKVNFGIDLSASVSGFYQAAIKMPVGVSGSAIQWQPTSGGWGVGESKIGVDSSGNFMIIGRYDSSGKRVISLYDNVNVGGQLIPISIRLAPQANQNSLIDLRSGAVNCSDAYILMPTGGVSGNFISWGDPAYDNSLIGIQASTGHFIIAGRADAAYGGRRTIYLYDDTIVTGNAYVYGNLNVSGTVNQGSDLSMKENVELFSGSALNLIKSIDVYKYLFKVDQREHVGFVANYVKDVFPMGVTINEEDGKCSINILDMLALLFKAVKELAEYVANN